MAARRWSPFRAICTVIVHGCNLQHYIYVDSSTEDSSRVFLYAAVRQSVRYSPRAVSERSSDFNFPANLIRRRALNVGDRRVTRKSQCPPRQKRQTSRHEVGSYHAVRNQLSATTGAAWLARADVAAATAASRLMISVYRPAGGDAINSCRASLLTLMARYLWHCPRRADTLTSSRQ